MQQGSTLLLTQVGCVLGRILLFKRKVVYALSDSFACPWTLAVAMPEFRRVYAACRLQLPAIAASCSL